MTSLITATSIDLGTYGKTYPVKEIAPHILIQEALKNFKMPKPKVMLVDLNLPRAKEQKTRLIDPTYTLDRDIVDEKGNVIIKKGTTVNPQEKFPLKRRYLFINPNIQEEIDLAKNSPKDVVIEIVNGNPDDVSKVIGRTVFKATQLHIERFGVKVTPSLVRGNGKLLEITELDASPSVGKR